MQGILGIIGSAHKSVKIVDDYVTDRTLDLLIFAGVKAEVKIYSRNRPIISSLRNYRRRKAFSRGLRFIETNQFSNRYILVDEKFLYIMSAPLNKMDKRKFNWIRIMDYKEVQSMINLMMMAENKRRNMLY